VTNTTGTHYLPYKLGCISGPHTFLARSGDTNTLCMADTFFGDMSGSTGKAGHPGEAGDSPASYNCPVLKLGEENNKKKEVTAPLGCRFDNMVQKCFGSLIILLFICSTSIPAKLTHKKSNLSLIDLASTLPLYWQQVHLAKHALHWRTRKETAV